MKNLAALIAITSLVVLPFASGQGSLQAITGFAGGPTMDVVPPGVGIVGVGSVNPTTGEMEWDSEEPYEVPKGRAYLIRFYISPNEGIPLVSLKHHRTAEVYPIPANMVNKVRVIEDPFEVNATHYDARFAPTDGVEGPLEITVVDATTNKVDQENVTIQ